MRQARRRIQDRHKAARSLENLLNRPEHVNVIHYSCESFYDRPDGSSPRITSIAVANLASNQSHSFSIHQVAERKGYPLNEIGMHYDELERIMLDDFYDFARAHKDHMWLHWNMRSIHYGFQAIAHRYKVLGGQPVEVHESQKIDLARLMYSLYGPRYIGHPRLQNIVQKNWISAKDFLTGAEEAEAFDKGEYVKLHYSTLRKVDIFASLAQRADDNSLLTDASWREIYGTNLLAFAERLRENALLRILEFVFAIIGLIAAVIQISTWIERLTK